MENNRGVRKIEWFYLRGSGCTACARATRFLDEKGIEIAERVPASRKLQAEDCRAVADGASRLIAMKGKQVDEFDLRGNVGEDALGAMLGPTGNMRAPLIVAGDTILVGFNEAVFEREFG